MFGSRSPPEDWCPSELHPSSGGQGLFLCSQLDAWCVDTLVSYILAAIQYDTTYILGLCNLQIIV